MISVIIPVYNTGQYLTRCVNSLVMQTYKELQIILVNDGSTDDSLSVMHKLENMDSRILIIDREHEGVSAARNAGLEVAAGAYVSFIDSDDWIELNAYQELMDILRNNDADAVYFEWTEEFSDGTSMTNRHAGKNKRIVEGDDVIKEYFKNEVPLRLSSGLLKSSLLEGVRFEVGREMGEDMLVSFQTLAQAQRIVYVDMPFYHRYYRNESLSNRLYFDRRDFGTATCTDVMIAYIQQEKPKLLQEAYAYSFNFYMVVMNYLLYYRCETENMDIYNAIMKRLPELWSLIDSPVKRLPVELSVAYIVLRWNKGLYHYIMVVYYRYIKKELNGKRQGNAR